MATTQSTYEQLLEENKGKVAAGVTLPSGTTVSNESFGTTNATDNLTFGSQLEQTPVNVKLPTTTTTTQAATAATEVPFKLVNPTTGREYGKPDYEAMLGTTISDEMWADIKSSASQRTEFLNMSPEEQYNQLAVKYGVTAIPTTTTEKLEDYTTKTDELKAQEEEKSRLQQEIENIQYSQLSQSINANLAGVSSALSESAEGPTTNIRPLLEERAAGAASNQLKIAQNTLKSAQISRQQAATKLQEAIDSGKASLIEDARENLVNSETRYIKAQEAAAAAEDEALTNTLGILNSLDSLGVLGSLDEAQTAALTSQLKGLDSNLLKGIVGTIQAKSAGETEALKFAATNTAAASISSLLPTFQTSSPTYEQAKSMSQGTYFSPEQILGFFGRSRDIYASDMSKEEKNNAIRELQSEISGTPTETVKSEAAQLASQAAEIDAMVQSGMIDSATAQNIKIKLGLSKEIESTGYTGSYGSTYTTGGETYTIPSGSGQSGVTYGMQNGEFVVNTPEDYAINGRYKDSFPSGVGVMCGEDANNIAGTSLFGTPYTTKLDKVDKSIDSAEEVAPGMFFVVPQGLTLKDANGNSFGTGHVGTILGINADGTLKTREANRKGKGEIAVYNDRTVDSILQGGQGGFVRNPNTESIKSSGNAAIDDLVARYKTALTDTSKDKIAEEAYKYGIRPTEFKALISIPAEYQVDFAVSTGQLPTRIRDNVAEMDRFQEIAIPLFEQGYTPLEVADIFQGFDITTMPEESRDVAKLFRNYAAGIEGFDLQSIARTFQGQIPEQAMVTTENKLLSTTGGSALTDTTKLRETLTKVNDVFAKLSGVDTSLLGAFDGTKFELTRQLYASDPQYQKIQELQSALTGLYADYRNKYAGAAVTPQEATFLNGIIADIQDQPATMQSKLSELANQMVMSNNSYRQQVGLPSVTPNQILNNSLRYEMYNNMASSLYEAAPDLETTMNQNYLINSGKEAIDNATTQQGQQIVQTLLNLGQFLIK